MVVDVTGSRDTPPRWLHMYPPWWHVPPTRAHNGHLDTQTWGDYPVHDQSPGRYVSISEAAALINSKPWDVVRLIEEQRVATVPMVETRSLLRYAEEHQG